MFHLAEHDYTYISAETFQCVHTFIPNNKCVYELYDVWSCGLCGTIRIAIECDVCLVAHCLGVLSISANVSTQIIIS